MDYDQKIAKILYEGSLYKQKKYIMEQFNFYKVQRAMNLLKWGYFDSETPPSIERLRRSASARLNEVIESPNPKASTSSGGFQATKLDGNYLVLEFVLEEWSADSDD